MSGDLERVSNNEGDSDAPGPMWSKEHVKVFMQLQNELGEAFKKNDNAAIDRILEEMKEVNKKYAATDPNPNPDPNVQL